MSKYLHAHLPKALVQRQRYLTGQVRILLHLNICQTLQQVTILEKTS